jgi:flagellar hook protein FlgE
MSISSISIGLSGMQANMRALDSQAHNVANVSTEGFAPQTASFREAAPAGSGVTLSLGGRDVSTGVDLTSSVVQSLGYKAGFELSAKLVSAADERLGFLLDMKA